MAVDLHKGYPYAVIEDSFKPKDGEGIVEGMMVALDANNELIKATDAADEYAMVAFNNQPTKFLENGGKVQAVTGENLIFHTDQFKVGPAYLIDSKLQVSQAGGEEGLLTLFAGGNNVVGRFRGFHQIGDKQMMRVELTRS